MRIEVLPLLNVIPLPCWIIFGEVESFTPKKLPEILPETLFVKSMALVK